MIDAIVGSLAASRLMEVLERLERMEIELMTNKGGRVNNPESETTNNCRWLTSAPENDHL